MSLEMPGPKASLILEEVRGSTRIRLNPDEVSLQEEYKALHWRGG